MRPSDLAAGVLLLATAFVLSLLAPERPSAAPPPPATWKVVGWNDLGMHCMDSDYSVFSILPPFNDLNAQVIDTAGDLVTNPGTMTLSYEAVADPTGSINRSSIGKTNFWSYVSALFGAALSPDAGLAGHDMPGAANTPRAFAFDAGRSLFKADGVPITPYDDARHKRPYPMMRLVLRSGAGAPLASSRVVLPVSDEMDCSACHASDSAPAAQPTGGWVHDGNHERDYRLNILRLHDEQHAGQSTYAAALAQAGYSAAGLETTVVTNGTPILCARCHQSNALPGTGIAGLPPLTTAVHGRHAGVVDPANGLTLGASSNRAACYRCHPGSETRCLRGAMGSAVAADGSLAMQCQSCHGGMSDVGSPGRVGWLDQPTCQNCHTGTATHNNGSIRYTTALEANGQRRTAVDSTYATQSDVPATGFSLYRFSSGHGGLACEACHGSTHAEYPAAHDNDNLQNQDFQGHAGTLVECAACHGTVPETVSGGPHGMHPVGADWVSDHEQVGSSNVSQCRACHGTNYRGTVLSLMQADRSFSTPWGTKTFFRGAKVTCYACHNGPSDDDPNPNHRPVAQSASATAAGSPVTIPLVATDQDGNALTLRIVSQPAHGTVALSGTTATYVPIPGFAGSDPFTFAAFDNAIDSNLATVTVTRRAEWAPFGKGYPGTGGTVPDLALGALPVLGTTTTISLSNPSGIAAQGWLVVSTETASIATGLGGALLVEPTLAIPLSVPAGGLALPWALPADPGLVGLSLYAQAAVADSGARFGWALSRGLRATLGP